MAKSIVPPEKPKFGLSDVLAIINETGITNPVKLVGIRGYYKKMGNPLTNDRGLYDDAIFVVADDAFISFNANTDPTNYKNGMATLKTGIWQYTPGKHGITRPAPYVPYWALVQAAPVTVTRDEVGDRTGFFGINIHKGGYGTTSSLGCQTIYPDQWDAFINVVYTLLKKNNQSIVPYILTSN